MSKSIFADGSTAKKRVLIEHQGDVMTMTPLGTPIVVPISLSDGPGTQEHTLHAAVLRMSNPRTGEEWHAEVAPGQSGASEVRKLASPTAAGAGSRLELQFAVPLQDEEQLAESRRWELTLFLKRWDGSPYTAMISGRVVDGQPAGEHDGVCSLEGDPDAYTEEERRSIYRVMKRHSRAQEEQKETLGKRDLLRRPEPAEYSVGRFRLTFADGKPRT